MLRDALARLLVGRVAGSRRQDDPAFAALLLNLSHVMHDGPDAPDVIAAARAAWERLTDRPVDPAAVWPAAEVAEIRRGSLLVLAPVGPLPGLGTEVELAVLRIDPEARTIPFFDAPARLSAVAVEAALARGRPIWFGWLARYPGGVEGGLAPLAEVGVGTASAASLMEALARRCEEPLRTYPDQCRATTPFWDHPFDDLAVPRTQG